MFGNALVLIVVYKSKQLRHSQYVYKCSVAISDIVWGSVISFYFIYISVLFYYENNFFFNESESFDLPIESADNSTTVYSYKVDTIQLLPKEIDSFTRVYDVLEYVLPVAFLVSIVTLACAAGDRYAALTFPFRYRRLDSLKFAKIISAAVWILCAFCFLYTFFRRRQRPVQNFFFATSFQKLSGLRGRNEPKSSFVDTLRPLHCSVGPHRLDDVQPHEKLHENEAS